MRPGFDVELRDTPVPRSAPTDTSTWFVADITEFGPVEPQLLLSPDDRAKVYGDRLSTSFFADAVETAFAEGASRVYVKRVVGDAADVATHSFSDATPAPTLAVDAAAPGAWYNDLRPAIIVDGAQFSIEVDHADDPGKLLTVSPLFDTKAQAVEWSQTNRYIRVRSLAPLTLPVAAAAVALAGGDDDIDGIDNDTWTAALASFGLLLGPGQVSLPGKTLAALHSAVLAHCAVNNRRGALDAPDDPNAAVLEAAAAAVRSDPNARFGAMFGPWDVIPGLTPNTKRTVPPCARAAGTIARSDSQTGNPNLPAAGDNGRAQYVIDLTQTYTDDEYTALNDAGVNMSRFVFGGDPQIYGFRTLVDPDVDPRWVEFSGSRTVMYATSAARGVMATFAFDQIDGQGHKFAELEGAIGGILLPLYRMGALYGSTPQEAYRVDAGTAVNTPERVQARELRSVLALKTSPFAEHVVTEIVRRLVTEEV